MSLYFYFDVHRNKKGPLARIWLAAHWDKKLTKAHVFETNIESSVEGILQPKVKMALRTSGHLLLGVVRIYSRKAKYLLADCNEAFIKIKMAFRPGVVDLPEENREAAVATITLPEVFHDFDSAMPELSDIDVHAQFTLNQSRAEEITMREDYGNITLVGDDGFGDMGFEDAEIVREASNMEATLDQASLLFGNKTKDKEDGNEAGNASNQSAIDKNVDLELDAPLRDDGFGGGVGEGLLSAETGGLFEPGGLFDDAPMDHVPMETATERNAASASTRSENKRDDKSDEEDDYYDVGPPSMGAPSSGPPSPASPAPVETQEVIKTTTEKPTEEAPPPQEQTTLIHNEDETFALAPLDNTAVPGFEKSKAKRKRKLIVDEVKNISGEEMKSQLSDTTDIVTTLDLAPPTKRLMHWKETGGVEKLFALPGRPIPSRVLSKSYQRHLTTRAVENEDFGLSAEDDLDLEIEAQKEKEREEAARNEALQQQQREEQFQQEQQQQLLEQQQQQFEQQLPPQTLPPPTQPPPQPRASRKRRHEAEPQPPVMVHDPPEKMSRQLPLSTDHLGMTPLSMDHMEQQNVSQPLLDDSLAQYANQLHPQPEFQPYENLQSHLPQDDLLQMQQPPMTPQMQPAPQMDPNQMPVDQSVHMSLDQSLHDQQYSVQPQQQDQQQSMFDTNPESLAPQQSFNLDEQMFTPQPSVMNDMRPVPTPHPLDAFDDIEGGPASVGPVEEQGADETYEQFEERVLNKRAQQMLHVCRSRFENQDKINFTDLVRLNNRKQVAQKFYTFLVLKKQQAVELEQEQAFGDMYILRGPRLETVY